MTTLQNRQKTALLVVDVQKGVVEGAHERDAVVANVGSLVEKVRRRGYDATLVSDAHTTEDQFSWGAPPPHQFVAHTNLYWTYQTAPGRTAGTVETKDVDFGSTP